MKRWVKKIIMFLLLERLIRSFYSFSDISKMHNMTVSFKKGSLLSRHVKCYISKEKLQELEDKIQDVNRTLGVLKNEIVVDRRFTHKNQNCEENIC